MIEQAPALTPGETVRSALAEIPTDARHRLTERAELVLGELRKVFALKPLDLGSGLGSIGDLDLFALSCGFLGHERH